MCNNTYDGDDRLNNTIINEAMRSLFPSFQTVLPFSSNIMIVMSEPLQTIESGPLRSGTRIFET